MVAGALALPAAAGADALHDLRTDIATVKGSVTHRYNLHDDQGGRMDALDIVQTGRGQYAGVYHTNSGLRFALQVATSTNLVTWTRRATLDTDASQGAISVLPGGGFVVAYEKSFFPVAPRPQLFHKPLPLPNAGRPLSQIRFRAYPGLDALLTGRQSAEYTAPRTLGLTAEGTPNIQRVSGGPGIDQTVIDVGFHYYTDINGDGTPDVDRQATGVLTNFGKWTTADSPLINAEFLHPLVLHPGFTLPPAGNLGDRDDFVFERRELAIDEVQYVEDDFGSWRLFLRDPGSGQVLPFSPVTRGHSRSFANPSITPVRTPAGNRALFVSLFVFAEGSAPGESGPLVYVVKVPR